jgi:hypothetical protein
MIDFLKANPYVTKEEYLWEWTVPQVRLASYDTTHVEYLTEKQAKMEKCRKHKVDASSLSSFANDLGMPIFRE